MITIAYIISGRKGMESFVYKELEYLENKGLNFKIFFTKLNWGPYLPKKNWSFYKIKYVELFLTNLFLFLSNPIVYFKYLLESIEYNVTSEFLLAGYYSKLMEKEQITHIHCHFADSKLFVGYFIKKFTKISLSSKYHSHEMYSSSPNIKFFSKVINFCDKLYTIADYNIHYLERNFMYSKTDISLLRLFPGIEVNKVYESNELVIDDRRKKLLMVASWVPKKGHNFLFKALEILDRNDFVVYLVGGPVNIGSRSVDVPLLVNKFKLDDKVKILGRLSDSKLYALYPLIDIFLVPSITEYDSLGKIVDAEGLPEVVKEAMSYSKPVIATKHVGIPEILDKELVEENNIEQLVKSLNFLLDNPNERKVQGTHNSKKVKEIYTNNDFNKLLRDFHLLSKP